MPVYTASCSLQAVVGATDSQPVLLLSNLINGSYNFSLTVVNKNNKRSTDSVTLTVLSNPFDKYIVEIHLNMDIWNFTQAHLVSLAELAALCTHTNLLPDFLYVLRPMV